MSNFNEHVLHGFHDELRKLALNLSGVGRAIQDFAGHAGNLGGVGAVAGGALGAGIGGYRKYQEAKEQGLQGGDAIRAALGGAGKGAVIGAGTGLGAGMAGGVALQHLAPQAAERALEIGRQLPGGGYGQRMAHTLTGWTPQGGVGQLGLGAAPLIERQRAAQDQAYGLLKEHFAQQRAHAAKDVIGGAGEYIAPQQRGIGGYLRRQVFGAEGDLRRRAESAAEEASRLGRAAGHAQRAEELGMTSIPGYLKAVAGQAVDPRTGQRVGGLSAAGTALKQRWESEGNLGKAMMFGLPVAFGANEVINKNPDDKRGFGERALSATGGVIAGTAFAPLSMTGEILAGSGAQKAMATGGRLLDKITGNKHPSLSVPETPMQYSQGMYGAHKFTPPKVQTTADRAEEQSAAVGSPTERYETARYRGEAPESLGS